MKTLLVLFALGFSAGALEAKSFEGTVRYRLLGGGKGQEMTVSVRQGKVRVDMDVRRGQGGSMIMDTVFKTTVLLLPEKKLYMRLPPEEPKVAEPKQFFNKLKKTGKLERIANFMAEEWAYEGEEKTSFWGSQELGGWAFTQPQGVVGDLALPYELRDGNFMLLRMKDAQGRGLEALAIQFKKLPADLFEVPFDYKETKGLAPDGAMSPENTEKMKKAMQDLTPEQKAMLEKLLKAQGAKK